MQILQGDDRFSVVAQNVDPDGFNRLFGAKRCTAAVVERATVGEMRSVGRICYRALCDDVTRDVGNTGLDDDSPARDRLGEGVLYVIAFLHALELRL